MMMGHRSVCVLFLLATVCALVSESVGLPASNDEATLEGYDDYEDSGDLGDYEDYVYIEDKKDYQDSEYGEIDDTDTLYQDASDTSEEDKCFEVPMKEEPGCQGNKVRYFYYDVIRRLCQAYESHGCPLTENYFATPERCMSVCSTERASYELRDARYACQQPKEAGTCRAAFTSYFYNKETNACKPFTYGGCGGNENNFGSMDDCVQRCVVLDVEETNELDLTCSSTPLLQPRLKVTRTTNSRMKIEWLQAAKATEGGHSDDVTHYVIKIAPMTWDGSSSDSASDVQVLTLQSGDESTVAVRNLKSISYDVTVTSHVECDNGANSTSVESFQTFHPKSLLKPQLEDKLEGTASTTVSVVMSTFGYEISGICRPISGRLSGDDAEEETPATVTKELRAGSYLATLTCEDLAPGTTYVMETRLHNGDQVSPIRSVRVHTAPVASSSSSPTVGGLRGVEEEEELSCRKCKRKVQRMQSKIEEQTWLIMKLSRSLANSPSHLEVTN